MSALRSVPLSLLCHALRREGAVPLAWVLTHALPDERDPLPRLWAESDAAAAMRLLLVEARHPAMAGYWPDGTYPEGFSCGAFTYHGRCEQCADAIRRVVPTLTLADLRGER